MFLVPCHRIGCYEKQQSVLPYIPALGIADYEDRRRRTLELTKAASSDLKFPTPYVSVLAQEFIRQLAEAFIYASALIDQEEGHALSNTYNSVWCLSDTTSV